MIDPSSQSDAQRATRIVLRPIATPFPLGFLALGVATLLVAGLELGWFAPSRGAMVAVGLIGFTFPLQLLATVFGFLGRDTVAATGFAVQSATWLVVGLSHLLSPPGSTDPVLGVFLVAAAGAVVICVIGASTGKVVPAVVLATTALRFAATGVYELTSSTAVEHVAGIIGLVLATEVVYAAVALELENLQRRTVLPLGRRGAGREAMTEDLAHQTRDVEHEAGVREQL